MAGTVHQWTPRRSTDQRKGGGSTKLCLSDLLLLGTVSGTVGDFAPEGFVLLVPDAQ